MVAFDAYTLRARTAPAALAAAPVLVLLLGGALAPSAAGRAGAWIAAAIGLVASQLARDAGRRLQPVLWKGWGGPPTVQRLRHRDAAEPVTVARLHARIEEVLAPCLPTREQEVADPNGADRRYDEAVADLRERTRDRQRFPLVFAENVSYGFRRNLLGLRQWGLGVALVAFAASAVLLGVDDGTLAERLGAWAPPVALALASVVFWWRVVTPSWVRSAAENYADRLFDALETLRTDPAPNTSPTAT